MKLGLLNTSILTTPGEYVLEDISLEQAQKLVHLYENELDSAIGHKATADVMSELLGVAIIAERKTFVQQAGQQALVFKLENKDRLKEGKVLNKAEIEELGCSFQLLIRKI